MTDQMDKTPCLEIEAWKAFNADFTCNGMQYEIGKTYEHEGDVAVCNSGFHACIDPLDLLKYYDITTSRFAKVVAGGAISVCKDDSKFASGTITIKAELRLPDFIREAVRTFVALCKKDCYKDGARDSAKNASSGDSATNASSGDSAKNASSGDYAKNASSGDSATNASSGDSAKNASSGHSATNASSGDSATNASSGDYAKNASSGDSAKNASSGDSATNASSGDSATNAATGKDSVIASGGINSQAKVGKNGCFTLTWHDGNRYRMVTGYAGENGIKADVWYSVDSAGNLVEVK